MRNMIMLEMRYDIDPDEDGIFDGRDIARQLIKDAYELLATYAGETPEQGNCPACADELFSVVANQEIAALHRLGKKIGRLPARSMLIARDEAQAVKDIENHVKATAAKTHDLLRKGEMNKLHQETESNGMLDLDDDIPF